MQASSGTRGAGTNSASQGVEEIRALRAALQRPLDAQAFEEELRPILVPSLEDPPRFFHSLLDLFRAEAQSPVKSSAATGFDFYHDLVIRHPQDRSAIALRWFEPARGWQSLSYSVLHARAGAQRELWLRHGVRPGETLALILPLGPELLVALCTALRLGLCVALLPPYGSRYLARRLAEVAPVHIASARRYAPLLGGFAEAALPVLPEDLRTWRSGSDSFESHTYRPGETALLLCSPLSERPWVPCPVPSEVAFLGALRDGMLIHGLARGRSLCAPEAHPIQEQPALLLSVLLQGATYVQIEADDVVRDPTRLLPATVGCELHRMGLGPRLRDALAPTSTTGFSIMNGWFTDPDCMMDAASWQRAARAPGFGRALGSTLHIDAAAGGCLLLGTRQHGPPGPLVLPAPGVAFEQVEPGRPQQRTLSRTARFRPLHLPETADGRILLSSRGGAFLYAGTEAPCRRGRTFPVVEVVDALRALPALHGATVIPGQSEQGGVFTLLVFCGAGPRRAADALDESVSTESQIASYLCRELDPESVPDRIERLPLMPRKVRGALDEAFYRVRWASGELQRMAGSRLFQLVSDLRAWIAEQEEEPLAAAEGVT